jgi:phytoene synthase
MKSVDVSSSQLASASIAKGSKSFRWASLLFSEELQVGAHRLYHWCRFCDDQIDEAPSLETARERYRRLVKKTDESLKASDVSQIQDPAFKSLHLAFKRYQIPARYAFDHLKGFEMDLGKNRYESFKELERYCYHVAGVVGLMMAHMMGVSRESALKNAVDLGIGMQLTNIARDVHEDLKRNRIYLPRDWLHQEGLTDDEKLVLPESSVALKRVIIKVLNQSVPYYRSGYSGLSCLSISCSLPIAVAGSVYQSIGRKKRKQNPMALSERVYVGLLGKIGASFRGLWKVFKTIPFRFKNPWKRVSITRDYRYE